MLNRLAYNLTGITDEQYRRWCVKNQLPHYKKETKLEFFKKVQSGKIVKNELGELVTIK